MNSSNPASPPPSGRVPPHPVVAAVTARIQARSRELRTAYLHHADAARASGSVRGRVGCANFAHAFAAAGVDSAPLRAARWPAIAIVSAYNDILSAHQPLNAFPELIKQAAREAGAVAQFAGGVPAMCDGVTQGEAGMELSLFSRDVIAMATAVALSHNIFDAALCMGVCDKIVPGLLIGALQFGHLPTIFVPAGPMSSGLSNPEKSKIRERFARGEISREALLEAEAQSYHEPGTCTFYGTANSNQMLMEIMGLHLPGASFVHPHSALRSALTVAATQRVAHLTALGDAYLPLARIVDEHAIVNGIVGLLATGGSTNHTLHLVAIARAAGIVIDWTDFAELSAIVPLLCRIYPNGSADVNHFHAAGGMAFLIRELLDAGLLHADVATVGGDGLASYAQEPMLVDGTLHWRPAPLSSLDPSVLRPVSDPFDREGGLRLLQGNLGRAIVKVSAVKPEFRAIEAPARVFESQEAVLAAFQRGELQQDFVAVVRYQGPRANGMPELHKLTPPLSVLQDQGLRVALVTDGRMSGASGKVLAAIHVTPESLDGGALAKIRDGDVICIDSERGELSVRVSAADWLQRPTPPLPDLSHNAWGTGRELFAAARANASSAEFGATTFGWATPVAGATIRLD